MVAHYLLVSLLYDNSTEATVLLRLRSLSRWAYADLRPKGTLVTEPKRRRALKVFRAWTQFVVLRQVRRRHERVIVAWGGMRRRLHTDDTPILPFG